jgi:hypothetical protein
VESDDDFGMQIGRLLGMVALVAMIVVARAAAERLHR